MENSWILITMGAVYAISGIIAVRRGLRKARTAVMVKTR